jgi:hypothetical protein
MTQFVGHALKESSERDGYGTVLLPVHALFDEKIELKVVVAVASTKNVVATRPDESAAGIPAVNRFVPVQVFVEINKPVLEVDAAVFTNAQFAACRVFVPAVAVGNVLIPVKLELPAMIAFAVIDA